MRELVVVGHGMVGPRLVQALSARDTERRWRITVLAEEARPAYARVALSSCVDGRSAEDLTLPVATHLGEAATAVDRAARAVTTVWQRIDLFGARVEQLPAIWRRVVDPGFEVRACVRQGAAHGEVVRRDDVVSLRPAGLRRARGGAGAALRAGGDAVTGVGLQQGDPAAVGREQGHPAAVGREQGHPAAVRWVDVCPLPRLLPERGVAALVHGAQVAVFRLHGGRLFALDNLGPFSGAAVLSRGIVGDRGGEPTVASPVFKQTFSLLDGRCLDDPDVSVATRMVRTTNEVVQVGIPCPTP